MDPAPAAPLELADYLRPLWARRFLIIGVAVAIAAGTYAYSRSQPAQFKSATTIFVQQSSTDGILGGASSDPSRTDRETQNQATLLRSRGIASRVARRLGRNEKPDAVRARVTIVPQAGQDFILITARDSTAVGAASLANAYAETFIEVRSSALRDRLAVARRRVERQLAAAGGATQLRQQLRDQLSAISAAQATPAGGSEQVDVAPPGSQTAPNPKRDAIFAFFIGFALACAGAFLLERLDHRIKRPEEFEEIYRNSVLAFVPHVSGLDRKREQPATDASRLREAFRSLRANLLLAGKERSLKTILVTSGVPSEGKSTVVGNLALAYAESGLRVVVVEADLRKPSLPAVLGVQPEAGLTEVLAGTVELKTALCAVDVRVSEPAALSAAGQVAVAPRLTSSTGSVDLLSSGCLPKNPPDYLAGDRMTTLLGYLATKFDLVLVDSAPLIPVGDTLALLPQVDGVILVTRIALTTTDAAKRVRATLDRMSGVEILGLVVDDVEPHGGYGDYGYGALAS